MSKALESTSTQTPERVIAIRAVIPAIESAIKVHGDEAAGARVIFDIYPDELDQLQELFKMRGLNLILVLKEEHE